MAGLTRDNLKIPKTVKLFIGGEFPRTESGRSFPVKHAGTGELYAHLCLASRKDMRNAVTAAKEALARVADVAAIEVDPQDGRITAFPKPGRSIFVAVSDALKGQGVAVRELALEGGRLDEVFRTVTQSAAGKEART